MQVSVDRSLSHMAMQWGQFLDHDVSHSMESISAQSFFTDGVVVGDSASAAAACGATCDNRAPCFPIQVGLWLVNIGSVANSGSLPGLLAAMRPMTETKV